MKPFIRVTNLSKLYPEALNLTEERVATYLADEEARAVAGVSFALRDVSFEVQDGERVGLIGANGAGKTTLMRLLSGLSEASAGKIDTHGKLQAILTIGSSLREDLTGRENLLLASRLAGYHDEKELQALTEQMASFADLEHFIDWPTRTYSSGMKARLSFASAIYIDPEILLIDEALSVGDRQFSVKANEAMRKLCSGGRILMIVSHATEAIVAMCDRCIWLDKGRQVMDGPAKEVAAAYEESMRLKFEQAMVKSAKKRLSILDQRVGSKGELRLELKSSPADDAMPVNGQSLSASIDVSLAAAVEGLDVDLTVERLDGLLIARNRISDPAHHPPGDITLEIEVPHFFLLSGFYLVAIDVSSAGTPLLHLEGQLQMKSDTTYKHGAPTFAWPMLVSSSSQ